MVRTTPLRRRTGQRVAAALLGLAILPACAITDYTAGQELRPAALSGLLPGQSTQADVLRELGPPDDLAELLYGSIWVYRLVEGDESLLEIAVYQGSAGITRTASRWTSLAVIFDRKGTLSAMGLALPGDE